MCGAGENYIKTFLQFTLWKLCPLHHDYTCTTLNRLSKCGISQHHSVMQIGLSDKQCCCPIRSSFSSMKSFVCRVLWSVYEWEGPTKTKNFICQVHQAFMISAVRKTECCPILYSSCTSFASIKSFVLGIYQRVHEMGLSVAYWYISSRLQYIVIVILDKMRCSDFELGHFSSVSGKLLVLCQFGLSI